MLSSIREKMQKEKSSKFILDNELIKKMELKKKFNREATSRSWFYQN